MYAKLVFKNAKRSAKDYLVYVITMTICVMLFYAFLSITSKYYNPDIGTEYEFTLVSDGLKMAICAVTLLLLFLIRYVNNYMLRRKQKEFAIQSVMGMEQKTVAWIFFAETFLMGAVSIVIGISLGVFCSQFITGMLLSTYGQGYKLSWTLFPDTVILTICFFSLSLLVMGLFNVHTIRKIKIIDMLYADKQNDPHIKRSRYMRVISILYTIFLILVVATGISKMYFYSDSRFPIPVHIMFWGNIIVPAISFLLSVVWYVVHKKWSFNRYILVAAIFSLINTGFAASVPIIQNTYMLVIGAGTLNSYMMFLLVDVAFWICCIIYLVSNLLSEWKEKSSKRKYRGTNLFFFGQIISKLNTTSKTMTLICLTLVLSVFLFVAAPALTGWASGYLDIRSLYDVQISTRYNDVYEIEDLPKGNYELVTTFLAEKNIAVTYDCTFDLYLPNQEDFHKRIKFDFPIVAISLSDYNALREMLGYEQVFLNEGEFTTQWQTIATEEDRNEFLSNHTVISTDMGTLSLAENAYHLEAIGETVYNSYTDVIYVFPDSICNNLLSVMRNRYVKTETAVPYNEAIYLENTFAQKYPEKPDNGNGVQYYIRTSTQQINSSIAGNFVLQATMIYSAVVLMVICLTILSLQQLLDAAHYKYRFGVLHKLGVDQQEADHLILKQLAVWFGLPITIAAFVSIIVIAYFFETISVQIFAYIGVGALLTQVGAMIGILVILLICYFISTWILFQKSVTE
ncbi:ABC transporter permease [Schaedlerella arabinosiphila]|uniref:ABC transporter permease n=1 Tax=Schaedlerella arabinosiphila TaxID=2044587 RepID=A0A3R8KZA5_9FIRM|nr:ABC transporter permease [Schaedlerella arabinosiphila]RRK35028.1 ABC transporter permease [Schaedlerella arabinosiphila]